MNLSSIVKPCYDRKIFWVRDQLVTFEFGELRVSSSTEETTAFFIATYVLYRTDAIGNPTGTSTCYFHRVNTREEGQKLFEAASEEGASAWLLAHQKKWDNYSQTAEIFNWLRQRCIRQLLYWRWIIRQQKRRKNI